MAIKNLKKNTKKDSYFAVLQKNWAVLCIFWLFRMTKKMEKRDVLPKCKACFSEMTYLCTR